MIFSILFYSIIFYCNVFYFILFCSILLYSIISYSILFYYSLYFILFYFILFNSILFYYILFYSIFHIIYSIFYLYNKTRHPYICANNRPKCWTDWAEFCLDTYGCYRLKKIYRIIFSNFFFTGNAIYTSLGTQRCQDN